MASIYGLQLKAVKTTYGMEGEGFVANLYMDNKRVGSVADYADGAMTNVCLEDKKVEVIRQVRQYYTDFPEVDYIASCAIVKTPEEHIQLWKENKLPVYDPEFMNPNELLEIFANHLYKMYYLEKLFVSAKRKGYSAIVTVDYPMIRGMGIPLPANYYTDGSIEVFNEIKKEAEEKFPVAIVKQYKTPDDFSIKLP